MAYNPYILVPLATFAVAQVAKFAIEAFRGNLDFRYLYRSGGMPSVHSAIVTSLATTALLVGGVGSPLFGFAIVLAVIVMYDSFGVRRAAGEQAKAINAIIDGLDVGRVRLENRPGRVREIMGHQPEEVIVGAVLGIILGCVLNYNKLGAVSSFLENTPKLTENIVYVSIGGVLIVATIIARILMGRRHSKILSQLSRQILVWGQTIGWLMVLASVLMYERASYLAWRLWVLAIIVIGLVWGASLMSHWRGHLPKALHAERDTARKNKWFTWGKRKAKR